MTLPTMAEVKADLIRRALREAEGSPELAARLIGVGSATIYRFNARQRACKAVRNDG